MSVPFPHLPPAQLDDLLLVARGHALWHAEINRILDSAVAGLKARMAQAGLAIGLAPPFFNPARNQPAGTAVQVPILWNAFPRQLVARHGRGKALVLADMLWPKDAPDAFDPLSPRSAATLRKTTRWVRPQDEYCEWRVERDAATQCIRRVVFSAESPEYWRLLYQADPSLVAGLYGRLLQQPVAQGDLLHLNVYDTCSRWNTSQGIVHLSHRANKLQAQVELCAEASLAVWRQRPGPPGRITDPHALCIAAGGRPNTHSDPTIVGTINALVRGGAAVSLAEPIGLCMDDVDTSGWALPGLADPRDLLHIERGAPGQILRLVVQAPPHSQRGLDALTIGDEPLLHGGQIAECITMKAVAQAVLPTISAPPVTVPATRRAWQSRLNPSLLLQQALTDLPLLDEQPAFTQDLPPL